MAGRKSNAVKAAEAAKAVENDPKTESIKTEEKKTEEKKAASTEKKEPAKKTAAKSTTKSTAAKKTETECVIHVQFAGKSYAQDELMKMAKDVWKYDLKQKAGDLTSVVLYVKPEENKVYYVMNGEFNGDFSI
ncbi:MAG: hypothetical protein HFH82_12060 [Lachnospiraceae bacterium]|nr:hypothetical protein [Lachnospiraceae bacterium]